MIDWNHITQQVNTMVQTRQLPDVLNLNTFAGFAGNGLLFTLLPLRGHADGFSSLDIGGIGSAYYAGFVGGCLLAPYISLRAGHIVHIAPPETIADGAQTQHLGKHTFPVIAALVSDIVTANSVSCRTFATTVNDIRGIRRYRGDACTTAGGRWQLRTVTPDDAAIS